MPPAKKLTPEQAQEIRRKYHELPSWKVSIRALAKEYGVSKSLIARVINNEAHITEEEN